MYIQIGRQSRQFRTFKSDFNLGLFQRIRAYSSQAFAVPNVLHLLLLLCARILDTAFGEKSKAESLATSAIIA